MSHREHELQKAVAQFLELALLPPNYWTAVDAGAGKLGKAAAGIAKARGVKAGIPDILVFAPRGKHTLVVGLELKAPGQDLSEAQRLTWNEIAEANVECTSAHSIEQVASILERYGIKLRPGVVVADVCSLHGVKLARK